jgi:hypothetical protein
MWVQTNNFGGGANAETWEELNFIVGQSVITPGQIVLTVPASGVRINSVKVTADGQRIFPGVTDQFSFTIVYNANNFAITFLNDAGDGNQGVQSGQKIIIDYAQVTI